MAFSQIDAVCIVARQGQGVTYGYNVHGGIVLLAPGKRTYAQMHADDALVVRVMFMPPTTKVQAAQERNAVARLNEWHEELNRLRAAGRFADARHLACHRPN